MREKFNLSPCGQRVFENRVLRRIFVGEKVKGGWRKLHDEELHDLWSSSYIYSATAHLSNTC
jgi:hypothetical protein